MPDISATIAVIIMLAAVLFLVLRKINVLTLKKSNPTYAQKFAKLLVAELKLYNQQRLESLHGTGNIYQQLKSEIDEARKKYDERVPLDSTVERDYFYEELVNGLAGGDAAKLGSGYLKRGA